MRKIEQQIWDAIKAKKSMTLSKIYIIFHNSLMRRMMEAAITAN